MFKQLINKLGSGAKSHSLSHQQGPNSKRESLRANGLVDKERLSSTVREYDVLEKNNNFLFIHIPKTAGTSFRQALEDNYPVLRDYGGKSAETSALIKSFIYEQKSPLSLKTGFKEMQDTWLTGHIYLNKYSNFVSARHIISFVRDPIERVISHYNHSVLHNGFEGDIDTFLQTYQAANYQKKHLNPLPLGLIGYVGLTDRYEESIQLINDYYGLNLTVKNANVNNNQVIKKAVISEDLRKQISDLNNIDIATVKHAKLLHKQRIALIEKNKQWVYSHFTINAQNILVGCAYYSHSSEPVCIDVFCNEEKITTVCAEGFYGHFPKVNFPRERYIGINLPLIKQVKKGDKLTLFAKETGQQLTFNPLLVKK